MKKLTQDHSHKKDSHMTMSRSMVKLRLGDGQAARQNRKRDNRSIEMLLFESEAAIT